ncbi:DNA polymerase V, partial [Acinetobacter baumannii]
MREIAPSIIKIKPYITQSIVLSEALSFNQVVPSTHMLIPYALEKISAGFPSPAQDYIDKVLDMNEHLIKNETSTFIVKVASLSMLNAGIDIDD